jgi:hypothetical protein
MRRFEARVVNSFEDDLVDDLAVTDHAAAVLLTVIQRATPAAVSTELQIEEDGTLKGDIGQLHLAVQVFIGVRGWRAMRAARAVLASGYEVESSPLTRILVELMAHRRVILGDPTGAEALAWLQGQRRRHISRRVNEFAPAGLYENLSRDSHGDPVGVDRLIDRETGSLELSPKRTNASRADLLLHAGFARDQAVVIADLAGFHLGGVESLDAAIQARATALGDDGNAAPPQPDVP